MKQTENGENENFVIVVSTLTMRFLAELSRNTHNFNTVATKAAIKPLNVRYTTIYSATEPP